MLDYSIKMKGTGVQLFVAHPSYFQLDRIHSIYCCSHDVSLRFCRQNVEHLTLPHVSHGYQHPSQPTCRQSQGSSSALFAKDHSKLLYWLLFAIVPFLERPRYRFAVESLILLIISFFSRTLSMVL